LGDAGAGLRVRFRGAASVFLLPKSSVLPVVGRSAGAAASAIVFEVE